jgi:predicted AAA+ superfamily ATPase
VTSDLRTELETHLEAAMREFNPWWERGYDPAWDEAVQRKSDFYAFAPGRLDERVVGVAGPPGSGKSTLLRDFVDSRIAAHRADDDRFAWDGYAPQRFCYLPLDEDPVFGVRADEQVRAAVRAYESYRLEGGVDEPHFVVIDDIHTATVSDETAERWVPLVADLLADAPGRRVVLTAAAELQLRRPLVTSDRLPDTEWTVRPVMPLKFRDYCGLRSPELGDGGHVSPTGARRYLEAVCRERDVTAGADDPEVRARYDRYGRETPADLGAALADFAASIGDCAPLRRGLLGYLTLGGQLSVQAAADATVDEPGRHPLADDDLVDRALHERLDALQDRAIGDLRVSLYKQISSLESIQNLDNLERLAALVAQLSQARHLPYAFLEDDAFDVDRRTLRDAYFDVLDRLQLFSASAEYDNKRPRAVRPYLRDVGLVNAFADRDHATVAEDREARLDLLRTAAFDHTVRLSYTVCDERDPKRGVVKYWRAGRNRGTVDCIAKPYGVPVPVTVAAGPNDLDRAHERVAAFLRLDDGVFRDEYDRFDERATDRERERSRAFVAGDVFNGRLTDAPGSGDGANRVATDAPPAFGLVLVEGHGSGGEVVSSRSVAVAGSGGDGDDTKTRPVYELPVWLYLALV